MVPRRPSAQAPLPPVAPTRGSLSEATGSAAAQVARLERQRTEGFRAFVAMADAGDGSRRLGFLPTCKEQIRREHEGRLRRCPHLHPHIFHHLQQRQSYHSRICGRCEPRLAWTNSHENGTCTTPPNEGLVTTPMTQHAPWSRRALIRQALVCRWHDWNWWIVVIARPRVALNRFFPLTRLDVDDDALEVASNPDANSCGPLPPLILQWSSKTESNTVRLRAPDGC